MQVPFLLSGRVKSHARLFLFHHALQGMLVLARKIHHLCDLGLGNLVGEHAALTDPVVMHMEHDLGGRLGVFLEEFLQHMNELPQDMGLVSSESVLELKTPE